MAERIVRVKRVYEVELECPISAYDGMSDEEIIALEKFHSEDLMLFVLDDLKQVECDVEILTVGGEL